MNDTLKSALDRHYQTVEKIILSRQDPITGLLPASTAVNAHGDYTDAWVRDNVYSILSVWGLSLSYGKHDPDHHRSFMLAQSVVKLMRGLLSSMMRQSDHVEVFKHTLNPTDALHAKYGTNTGLPVVGDDEWGHLQLDATSIYLLMLAQMTASGLRIIYTMDEVNFIQNLVHYISRTYCIPDYGIWERGNKINHGTTEINASSVGMAKAALEALSGFNLFGNVASQEAVIHVLPNDIARSRFTLKSLLPRESISKESDAALLSIIGYPAYAIEDEMLVDHTRRKIIKKLAGNYGCKRFLLDGHQSAIEDHTRLHYEASELREFEHIESEWPLFFTYLLLDAHMRSDSVLIAHWREKLEPLFIEQDGERLLPELYIVPKEKIEAEKAHPGSQERVPNENIPLVWAQSLFMLSDMISDGILHPDDIDPLRRRQRIGHTRNTHPLVSVLAEDEMVKRELLDLGFSSETVQEVKPLKIMQAVELSKVHTMIGTNKKLSLTGRPFLVSRSINTARLHVLAGEKILFLPYYFNPQGFYTAYDSKLLVEQFRGSLKFLARHWDLPGQPILPFLVRRDMLSDEGRDTVLGLLNQLQTHKCDDLVIKTGPLSQLLTTASIERVDQIHHIALETLAPSMHTTLANIQHTNETPLTYQEIETLESKDDQGLIETLIQTNNRRIQTHALYLLWKRQGKDFVVEALENQTLSQIADEAYKSAAETHDWAVMRRIADISLKYDDRLEDVLLDIVIRQKRFAIGRTYSEKAIIAKPMESTAVVKIIDEFSGNNAAERVLTQEVMLHLGHMIQTEPGLFENLLTLRSWYFIQLLVSGISREKSIPMGEAYEQLLCLAPHAIYDRLKKVLQTFSQQTTQLVHQETLHATSIPSFNHIGEMTLPENMGVDDWLEWRQQIGMLGHLDRHFYKEVWYMLQQCEGLVIGDKFSIQSRIGKERTLDSTAGERSFELRIDTMLQGIQSPEYRQLNIEAIRSIAKLFKQNPTFSISDDLILDVLIGHAVRIAWEKDHPGTIYSEERSAAWERFYHYSPKESETAFIEAFAFLLEPERFNTEYNSASEII